MSGRYEPHDEYVSCDIASWDEMPSHWHIGRIKYMTMMNPSKSEVRHLKSETPVTFLPMESIGDDGSLDVSKERPLHSVLSGYTYLAEGDVCVAKITPCFENGKGAIAHGLRNGIGFATTEVIPMRCNRTTDSQYLYYFLTCAPFNLDAEASMYGAGGQKRVADSFVANYSAAIPPKDEQKQIAAFLDYETAKIDALISKQQQLIGLLGEKRQAVISHAVTKGLNPDAPMRDSGIEWLGQVPEHWDVKRLKHISPKVGVGLVINPSTYTKEEGVYFIFGGDVKEYGFKLQKTRRISPEDSDRLLPSRLNADDLVSVRVGEPGITAVVPPELEGSNCASILVIRRGPFDSHWLCSAMNSWVGRQQVGLVAYGAAQKQFNVSDAVEFVFPFPPPTEQTEIARFIAAKLTRFDSLTERAESAVELLQERRTALISAAVTGKIDVRGWKPPSSHQAKETEMEVA